MTNEKLNLTIAKGVAVEPGEDGVNTTLWFDTGKPPTGVVVTPKDLSYLITASIQVAAKIAEKRAPDLRQGKPLGTVLPIPTYSMGVARGNGPTEALLAMQVGPLTLTFLVEVAMLRQLSTDLKALEL